MIKNILKFSFIAAVAVAAGYTAYSHSQKEEVLSDVALSNVEALARGEGGGLPWNGMYTDWSKLCCESGRPSDQCGASFMPCH